MKFQLILTLFLLTITKADWSDTVYDTLKYVANYAKVAYCTADITFVKGEMEDSCPLVEFCRDSNTTEIAQVFHPDLLELEISGSAYVAADHTNKTVYAVFRGSFSAGDFITDVLFGFCPYAPVLQNDDINADLFSNITSNSTSEEVADLINDNSDGAVCDDCLVHCGVYVALTRFIQEVYDSSKTYLDQGYDLVITGHSLGGGYTTLAGIEFLLAGYQPKVISFAALRVGNPAFNKFVDKHFDTQANAEIVGNGGDLPIPSISRVYQETDIVPRLPPGNYTHAGLEFEITKLRLPHLKENVVYKGASDNDANDVFDFDLSDPLALFIVYQHLHEFIRISWPCNDLQFKKRSDELLALDFTI